MGADKWETASRDGIKNAPSSRKKKRMRPDEGTYWVWMTQEMLESPAWRVMRLAARKVIDRLMIEHCAHSIQENGNLIVTYTDFQRFGIRRPSIADAIVEAETLGWTDVVERGGSAYAEFRHPSRYALAWLDRKDGTPPTNRWKRFESVADARRAVKKALAAAKRGRLVTKNKKPVTFSTRTSNESATGAGYANVTGINNEPVTES